MDLTNFPFPVLLVNENLDILSISRKSYPLLELQSNSDLKTAIRLFTELLTSNAMFSNKLTAIFQGIIEPGQTVTEELALEIRKEVRFFEGTVSLYKENESRQFFVFLREISDEKAYQEIYIQTRKYLESIINSIHLGIIVTDKDGNITSWNKHQERILEQFNIHENLVDVIGKKINMIVPESLREEFETIYALVNRKKETVTISQVKVPGKEADSFLDISIIPLLDGDKLSGIVQVMEEVTDQVNMEQQLIKSEKMALIGQIAVTMNHEINNPLTSIIGNCQYLLYSNEEMHSDIKTRLEKIEYNAKRIAEITEKLNQLKEIRSKPYLTDAIRMLDLD